MSFQTNLGANSQPGRPARVKPVVMRAPDQASGYEWASSSLNPDAIQRVQQMYLKNQQMPPGLAPKTVTLPYPLEIRRRMNISKGWRNPRGAA